MGSGREAGEVAWHDSDGGGSRRVSRRVTMGTGLRDESARLDDKAGVELVGLGNSSARATSPTGVSVEAGRKDEWVTRKL